MFFQKNIISKRELILKILVGLKILGDEQTQQNNRRSMKQEANDAWNEYTAIRERMAEEEKERRRRELLGE